MGLYKDTNFKYIKSLGSNLKKMGSLMVKLHQLPGKSTGSHLWPAVSTLLCSSFSAQRGKCKMLRSCLLPLDGCENKNVLSDFLLKRTQDYFEGSRGQFIKFYFPSLLEFIFIKPHKEFRAV